MRAWRHSRLAQIDRGNVRRLVPASAFQTGDAEGGLQATPIVVVLYLSSAHDRVYALDAATGAQRWRYDYPLPRDFVNFYGPGNRGVAVADGRVFLGTLDNTVVALGARTGRELWRTNVEDAQQCGCSITGAPLVVGGRVLTGVTGGDTAHRGYVSAFDARTGRMLWRFWTIPGPAAATADRRSRTRWAGGSSWPRRRGWPRRCPG
jgi:alcohol dehydrogenase (cytochrome c)